MFQIVRTGKKKPNLSKFTIPIEPVEYKVREIPERIATFDTETDPFLAGRIIRPFTAGLYFPDTEEYIDFWGEDGECIEHFIAWLKDYKGPKLSLFVHNGGNFDFYFLREYFDSGHKPFIINGRLVEVEIFGHKFRDSYAMIPVALGSYDKEKIDYRCMERGFRDIFREQILHYQKRDCTALAELVTNWLDMFGNKKTMASVALPMLRSYQGFETLTEKQDEELRPFYFGGRNQCFATGVITGDFKIYDINSSYPNVMRAFNHPIGDLPKYGNRITPNTHFAKIRAWSLGALPIRKHDGSLDFPIGTNDFFACIHEINAGLETGTLRIKKVYYTIEFNAESNFAEFVDTFYAMRLAAGEAGDEIRKLFYKLVLNSSSGKFAQDPRKYENYIFSPETIPKPQYCDTCFQALRKDKKAVRCDSCKSETTSPYGWYLHSGKDDCMLYAAPQQVKGSGFFNVATAASITSAARAELLRGIQGATRPLYCDTDSLICERLDGVVMDDKKLGGWKLEARGNKVAIAGKKLYTVWQDDGDGSLDVVKKASKGVMLTADEIERVANGDVVKYCHPVPKLKLDGNHQFIERNIKRTG